MNSIAALAMVSLLLFQPEPVPQPSSGAFLLHRSAARGETAAVKLLTDMGVDADARDAEGKTPLQVASLGGHTETVITLLETGANIDAVDPDGLTALHYAALGGKVPVIQALLERGADPSIKDRSGKTPLEMATQMQRTEAAEAIKTWQSKSGKP